MCVRGINFASFYDFVYWMLAPTVWYFFYWMLALFWQCGILFTGCWHCSDSVVFCLLDVGIVLTMWYFLIGCWHCSDSVVFFHWMLSLFWQCGIFSLDVVIVLTVWYFFIGCWHCSESVLFFLLDVDIVLTVWYFDFHSILYIRQGQILWRRNHSLSLCIHHRNRGTI